MILQSFWGSFDNFELRVSKNNIGVSRFSPYNAHDIYFRIIIFLNKFIKKASARWPPVYIAFAPMGEKALIIIDLPTCVGTFIHDHNV